MTTLSRLIEKINLIRDSNRRPSGLYPLQYIVSQFILLTEISSIVKSLLWVVHSNCEHAHKDLSDRSITRFRDEVSTVAVLCPPTRLVPFPTQASLLPGQIPKYSYAWKRVGGKPKCTALWLCTKDVQKTNHEIIKSRREVINMEDSHTAIWLKT
jgi:hypothetical protein